MDISERGDEQGIKAWGDGLKLSGSSNYEDERGTVAGGSTVDCRRIPEGGWSEGVMQEVGPPDAIHEAVKYLKPLQNCRNDKQAETIEAML